MLRFRWPKSRLPKISSPRFCGSSRNYGCRHHQRQHETFDRHAFKSSHGRSATECQGKRPDPPTPFRMPGKRVTGRTSNLGFRPVRKTSINFASSGGIWGNRVTWLSLPLMRRGTSKLAADSKEFELTTRVESILSGTLGALPQPLIPRNLAAGIGPLIGGVTFAVLFCVIPWLIPGTSHKLLALASWGAVYFAFAATTAKLTSASVLRIIQDNILPELSESAAKAIDNDLARRFRPLRLNIVASCAALAATIASAFVIKNNLDVPWVEVIWWCVGFFFLYFISARTTEAYPVVPGSSIFSGCPISAA